MTVWTKPAMAFLGLGRMGAPMASRLLAAGHSLTVWNRSREKARPLVEQGAREAGSPREAGSNADLAILMLADGSAVSEVLCAQGLAEVMRPGSIVVDMSSIPPAVASAHADQLAERGVHYLDAPVSGGTKGAREGTLAIMVGGSAAVLDLARPSLEVLGRPILIGRNGCGQLAKLATQVIVAATIGAVAEALFLAAAGGADPAKVREALTGVFADGMILKLHGERMLSRTWTAGASIHTQVKDLRTALEVASSLGLQLPLSSKMTELFESGVKSGFGDYDHSALLLELERMNPIAPPVRPLSKDS